MEILAPLQSSDFELAENLEFRHAIIFRKALKEALKAMASYGTSREHMDVVALLLVEAQVQENEGFREMERQRRAQSKLASDAKTD